MEKLNEQVSWEVDGGPGHGISFGMVKPDGSVAANFDVIDNAAAPDVNWLRHLP